MSPLPEARNLRGKSACSTKNCSEAPGQGRQARGEAKRQQKNNNKGSSEEGKRGGVVVERQSGIQSRKAMPACPIHNIEKEGGCKAPTCCQEKNNDHDCNTSGISFRPTIQLYPDACPLEVQMARPDQTVAGEVVDPGVDKRLEGRNDKSISFREDCRIFPTSFGASSLSSVSFNTDAEVAPAAPR